MSQRIRLFMKSNMKENNRRNISFNFKKIYKNDYLSSSKKKKGNRNILSRTRNRVFTPPSIHPMSMSPSSIIYNTEIWNSKTKIEEIFSETEGVSTNIPDYSRVFSASINESKRNRITSH